MFLLCSRGGNLSDSAGTLFGNCFSRMSRAIYELTSIPLVKLAVDFLSNSFGYFLIAESHRNTFRFTPMMSIVIGVVSALLIVALVVILVLRLQCTQNGGRRKRQKNGVVGSGSGEHRGSLSGPSDKGGKIKLNFICTCILDS